MSVSMPGFDRVGCGLVAPWDAYLFVLTTMPFSSICE